MPVEKKTATKRKPGRAKPQPALAPIPWSPPTPLEELTRPIGQQRENKSGLWVLVVLAVLLFFYVSRRSSAPTPATTTVPSAQAAVTPATVKQAPLAVVKKTAPLKAMPLVFERSQQPTIAIPCWRAANANASLEVFGPRNQKIRVLSSEPGAEGWSKVLWDGNDANGAKVPAGLYYLRPSDPGVQQVREVWVKG